MLNPNLSYPYLPRFLPVQSLFGNESCLIPIVYNKCLLAILYRATGLHFACCFCWSRTNRDISLVQSAACCPASSCPLHLCCTQPLWLKPYIVWTAHMKCCGAQPEFTQMQCLWSLSEAHIYFTLVPCKCSLMNSTYHFCFYFPSSSRCRDIPPMSISLAWHWGIKLLWKYWLNMHTMCLKYIRVKIFTLWPNLCTRMMQFGPHYPLKRLYAVEAYRFLFIFHSQLSNVVRLSVPFSIFFWNIWTWVHPRLVFSSLS